MKQKANAFLRQWLHVLFAINYIAVLHCPVMPFLPFLSPARLLWVLSPSVQLTCSYSGQKQPQYCQIQWLLLCLCLILPLVLLETILVLVPPHWPGFSLLSLSPPFLLDLQMWNSPRLQCWVSSPAYFPLDYLTNPRDLYTILTPMTQMCIYNSGFSCGLSRAQKTTRSCWVFFSHSYFILSVFQAVFLISQFRSATLLSTPGPHGSLPWYTVYPACATFWNQEVCLSLPSHRIHSHFLQPPRHFLKLPTSVIRLCAP